MNLNPRCNWPNCECKTEKSEPCKFEDPDFYAKPKEHPKSVYWPKTDPYAGRQFVEDVLRELDAARLKFPSSVCCLAALHEESGELAQAMLKHAAGKWPHSRIREEAIQVAAMAMRCALEGDPSLTAMGYSEPNAENQ